ncbi:MAG TPA: amidohydrolase family protein [Gemmatimonadales bacterium]|nr:amidohydrolase family protein [Gemmatimonadales bacterium]
MRARRLRAGWVFPVAGPPIRRGAVLLDEHGTIIAVGPADTVPLPPGVPDQDFPGGVLFPGLINTHTHLELTGFDTAEPDAPFADWIRGVRAFKNRRQPADFHAAACRGLAECHGSGVTTIADTGDSGSVIAALADLGGRGIYYQEVFGPHPDQWAESLLGLQERIAELSRFTSQQVRLGVSPHAPYSVSGPLYHATARWARETGWPMAVHIAESADESALLADATGRFAEQWARRGLPMPPPGRSPVEWLDENGVLGPATLCIHVVRAHAGDIARLAERGAAVAHCPLSNQRHGHGNAPLRALLDAGIRVGIGTDSVASVGRLDLLAEARAARELAGLTAAQTLAMLTTGGAAALGIADQVGELRPGLAGDCAVWELPNTESADAPVLLESWLAGAGKVVATWIGGREVYRQ